MDRSDNKRLKDALHKLSSKDLIGAELQETKLIYNVIGFLSATEYVDSGLLISNLGCILSEKGLNTCIIDFNVFYPNLFSYFNIQSNNKGEGLLKFMKSDKTDIRQELLHTPYDKLFLLSPSPQDLFEEYFDFTFENIEQVIEIVKSTFDIVLINIPNNPPFEFCMASMKFCHRGFVLSAERIDAPRNIIKLFDFANSLGISTAKFANLIMMNLMDLKYDYNVFEEIGLKVVAAIPYVKSALSHSLEGRIYLKEGKGVNKYFYREINRLANILSEQ